MYANTAAREETACLTGYCMGYSTWITKAFFLFYSWINAIENPHTQGSVALRSCKLIKFFIQNLTGECVYLIEVTAYFTAVKFRINTAHDFLRGTLKEIQQRWTSDTCQLCLGVGGALNFRESTQLKSRVAFSKNNSAQSKQPKTTFGRAQSMGFSLWGPAQPLWEQLSWRYLLEMAQQPPGPTSATSDPAPGTHWLPSLCSCSSSFLFPPSEWHWAGIGV